MALRAQKTLVQPQQQETPHLHLVTEEVAPVRESIAQERGYSQLHLMAIANNVAGIRRALRDGHSLDCRTEFGETPLMVAVEAKRVEAAVLLLSLGAQADVRDHFRGVTALINASIEGSIDLICLLGHYLKQEGRALQIDSRDRNGNTALHWAVEEGTRGAINSLLYIGANRDITNNDGFTPETYAKALGRNAMARACRRSSVALPMIRNAKVRTLFYSQRNATVLPPAQRCESHQPATDRQLPTAPVAQLRVARAARPLVTIG